MTASIARIAIGWKMAVWGNRHFAPLEFAKALRDPHDEAAKLSQQWVELPIVDGHNEAGAWGR